VQVDTLLRSVFRLGKSSPAYVAVDRMSFKVILATDQHGSSRILPLDLIREIPVNLWRKISASQRKSWTNRLRSYGGSTFSLVGAEAQQSGDASDLVKLGLVLHIHQLHIATDGRRDNCFAHVFQFLRAPAADRTIAHHVGIEMAAARAFDRVRGIILGYQQHLYFAHFERTQDSTQARHSAPVAPCLAEDFPHLLVPMLSEPLSHHTVSLFPHLLRSGTAHLGYESP
jgi:hypothetical protein